jgi:hypothetical protein
MIEIVQRELPPTGAKITEFLDVVDSVHRGNPVYIRPLDQEIKDRLNTKKNPFFEHGEAVIFLAKKNGKVVGRCTAQIDREHIERYKDATGFFGFFDTIDDEEVAKKLLTAAEDWLRKKGMKRVRGPVSLSINEEMGCLVEGFDAPPVFMFPYNAPHQGALIEKSGYEKTKDLLGWRYETGELNARTKRAHDEISSLPEVTSRPVSYKDLERDIGIVVDVYNDAWSDNWGFVPLTKSELRKMAEDFKLILSPEITRIAYIDGEPAAVAVAVPNLNEITRDLNGQLFPFGFAKLLWRLKVEGAKSGRMLILGIRKKYRNVRKYAALSAFLYGEMNDGGRRLGMKWGELGWTLEDNGAMNAGIRMVGGKVYKKYRVYERSLEGSGAQSS